MKLHTKIRHKVGVYIALIATAFVGFLFKQTEEEDPSVTFSKTNLTASEDMTDLMFEKAFADVPYVGCGG